MSTMPHRARAAVAAALVHSCPPFALLQPAPPRPAGACWPRPPPNAVARAAAAAAAASTPAPPWAAAVVVASAAYTLAIAAALCLGPAPLPRWRDGEMDGIPGPGLAAAPADGAAPAVAPVRAAPAAFALSGAAALLRRWTDGPPGTDPSRSSPRASALDDLLRALHAVPHLASALPLALAYGALLWASWRPDSLSLLLPGSLEAGLAALMDPAGPRWAPQWMPSLKEISLLLGRCDVAAGSVAVHVMAVNVAAGGWARGAWAAERASGRGGVGGDGGGVDRGGGGEGGGGGAVATAGAGAAPPLGQAWEGSGGFATSGRGAAAPAARATRAVRRWAAKGAAAARGLAAVMAAWVGGGSGARWRFIVGLCVLTGPAGILALAVTGMGWSSSRSAVGSSGS